MLEVPYKLKPMAIVKDLDPADPGYRTAIQISPTSLETDAVVTV